MDSLKLSNQLCFPLYASAKGIVKLYTPFLNEINLTYTQYITMMIMWEKKKIGTKELGKCLYLDSGTLTPLLKKLEQRGFVTRRRFQKDERDLVVEITESGEALKGQVADIPTKIMECLKLNTNESGILYQLLYKILNQM